MPDTEPALAQWQAAMSREEAAPVQRSLRRAPDTARATLLAALEASQQAGLRRHPANADRHAIVAAAQNVGTSLLLREQPRFLADPDFLDTAMMVHGLDSFAASLVGEVLGFRGETSISGAAQASGLLALIHAARLLSCDEADVVLVLGVPPVLCAMEIQAYRALGALGGHPDVPEDGCRPLDQNASGFVPTETAAALVLEQPRHAAARGAAALATLSGWNSRLHASIQPGPDLDSEVAVMAGALSMAGLDASDIRLVSAHATGTSLGDLTEAEAIARTFGDGPLVNAPKGIVGHALSAAGVLETAICVMQMQLGWAHGNHGLQQPVLRGLRYVPAHGRDVALPAVLKTGFGFGGFNAAVALTGSRPR
jgi:malonyl-ACP decarboxylase